MEPVGMTATRIPAGERTGRRALTFARWAWMGVALLLVGNFVASIPVYYRTLRTVCTLSVNPCHSWQPTPDNMLALSRLHIPVDVYAAYFISLDVAASLLYWTVGILIFWRKSNEWMGLFFSLVLIIFGSCGISDTLLGTYLSFDAPFLLGLPLLFLNLIQWPLLGTFLVTFPTGRFAPRWSWIIVLLWIGQLGFFWLTNVVPVLSNFILLVVLATYGSTFGLQVYRYVRVYDRVQRQQVKWCLYAFCTGLAVVIVGDGVLGGLVAPLNAPDSWFQLLNGTFVVFLFAPIPLAIGVAIFRYHLYDIDILINRTLVYGTLSASVIGLYVLIVGYFAALFRIPNNPAFSLIATALVAIVFQPLRGLLQRVVNRLMYGERDAPYQILARLDQQLALASPPEEVLPQLVKTIASTLKLPYVAVMVVQSDASSISEERLVAIHGHPTPHTKIARFPLVYQGETVGQFVLAPRPGEVQLTRADQHVLEDLARHAGVIVHAARLTSDLRRSRERIVIAREEERRRLRRDLHDGLGPMLASLTLTLAAAREYLPHDPTTTDTLLQALATHVQGAVADIRRLVYELRPPALDDLGLVGALREQAARSAQGGVQVDVEAPQTVDPLPAAVEVAAYRIGVEALTNVVRHAQANSCTIQLRRERDLVIEISDDGRGLPRDLPRGIGLRSMRERAEELGGSCVIASRSEGGTLVTVHLPLAEEGEGGNGTGD
jgi:signal transduction histidine kinase